MSHSDAKFDALVTRGTKTGGSCYYVDWWQGVVFHRDGADSFYLDCRWRNPRSESLRYDGHVVEKGEHSEWDDVVSVMLRTALGVNRERSVFMAPSPTERLSGNSRWKSVRELQPLCQASDLELKVEDKDKPFGP
jgi:hypothetical protein